MADVSRADVCVVACADAWRGDGELLASPIGPIPAMAARLAHAVFEPDLLLIDGEATLVRGTWAVGTAPTGPAEGWLPYRAVFDLVWRGRRHIMMGPSQIDRYGNANISCIGDFAKPKVQLLGVRGAPGNTVNHPVSYWVPKHSSPRLRRPRRHGLRRRLRPSRRLAGRRPLPRSAPRRQQPRRLRLRRPRPPPAHRLRPPRRHRRRHRRGHRLRARRRRRPDRDAAGRPPKSSTSSTP